MPDYIAYHTSLTDELHALKDRVRNLSEHWPTDGEYKEAALRTVLRRHLPASLIVGRGFIVTPDDSSTQLDLLIVDGTKPTLFRDGDLMFVTPDCVRAIIEVKTSITSAPALEECSVKLANVGHLCRTCVDSVPWLGIFSYEGTIVNYELLVDAVDRAGQQTDIPTNCVAYGKNYFIRYWAHNEHEQGDTPNDAAEARWRGYHLNNLASSYFVGNVVDALSTLDRRSNGYAWFPLPDGKRHHMTHERRLGG